MHTEIKEKLIRSLKNLTDISEMCCMRTAILDTCESNQTVQRELMDLKSNDNMYTPVACNGGLPNSSRTKYYVQWAVHLKQCYVLSTYTQAIFQELNYETCGVLL